MAAGDVAKEGGAFKERGAAKEGGAFKERGASKEKGRAFVFLAEGFEETEALTTVDILRRCGVETTVVGLTGCYVTGRSRITVKADAVLDDGMAARIADEPCSTALILPGGGVAEEYSRSVVLARLLKGHAANGGLIAAICIAPTFLAGLGLLRGVTATCYPGNENKLTANGARVGRLGVHVYGNFITAKGPGKTARFALAVGERLTDAKTAADAARGFVL